VASKQTVCARRPTALTVKNNGITLSVNGSLDAALASHLTQVTCILRQLEVEKQRRSAPDRLYSSFVKRGTRNQTTGALDLTLRSASWMRNTSPLIACRRNAMMICTSRRSSCTMQSRELTTLFAGATTDDWDPVLFDDYQCQE
jgi:hypothetical protein